MKRWIEITDVYVLKLKPYARRKIRLQGGEEVWAYWDRKEGCFYWNQGEDAVYMDDEKQRPTHVLIG